MKKTQYGWIIFVIIPIIATVVLFNKPDTQAILILLSVTILLMLLFYKLTISVSDEYVRFSFGIGLIRGKYRIKDIVRCKPIHYFPFGWGIRFRPGVILYNVSGNKAIELEIKNKNLKRWIGTNAPTELSDYINSKLPGK